MTEQEIEIQSLKQRVTKLEEQIELALKRTRLARNQVQSANALLTASECNLSGIPEPKVGP